MFDVFGYDDGQGDVEVLPDCPADNTFVSDGMFSFPIQRAPMMVIFTDGE